jgi:hypothetical protein
MSGSCVPSLRREFALMVHAGLSEFVCRRWGTVCAIMVGGDHWPKRERDDAGAPHARKSHGTYDGRQAYTGGCCAFIFANESGRFPHHYTRNARIGATGFEPVASTQNTLKDEPLHLKAAQIPAQLMNDLRFRNVMQAWQDLPQVIRAAIIALINPA